MLLASGVPPVRGCAAAGRLQQKVEAFCREAQPRESRTSAAVPLRGDKNKRLMDFTEGLCRLSLERNADMLRCTAFAITSCTWGCVSLPKPHGVRSWAAQRPALEIVASKVVANVMS